MSFCAESFKDSAAYHSRGVPGCSRGFWNLLHGAPSPGLETPLRLSQKSVGGMAGTVLRQLLNVPSQINKRSSISLTCVHRG